MSGFQAVNKLTRLLQQSKRPIVIGVVHLKPLPGTPFYNNNHNNGVTALRSITESAVKEASIYIEHGVNAILLENMHDIPYTREFDLDPATPATMAVCAGELRRRFPDIPLGIQILAGANRAAVAVAKAAQLDFIRAESFVYGHVADEGWMDACAGPLLRYRRSLEAEKEILVLADLKKKHCAHAVTRDVSLAETAAAVAFFRGDGVVVTGSATGMKTSPADVREVVEVLKGNFDPLCTGDDVCPFPVFIGSGMTPDNVTEYPGVSGFIVGSWVKKGHHWANTLSSKNVANFVKAVKSL